MATLYLAIYPSAAAAPTWNRANVGTNAGFSGSPVYTATNTSPTTSGDYSFSPDATGLTAGTEYKSYVVWDDGTETRPSDGPLASAEWTTLTVSESITVTEIAASTVFEGADGSGQVTISGTHGGSTDTIQAQIETTAGGVVSAWQTLQASVAPGTYSGTVSVPRGGWYRARVRKAASPATSALQTNRWGVGIVVVVTGQSHVSNWANGTHVAANDRAVTYNGTSWSALGDTGTLSLANTLIAAVDCPVAVIVMGNPGAPLGSWWNGTTKQSGYTSWESKITGGGTGVSAFFWWQGEGNLGNTKEAYRSAVASMFAQIRADHGATLPIGVFALGRNTAGTSSDTEYEAIRDAHIDLGNDANTYCISTLDFTLTDGVHFGIPGTSYLASARMAQCVLAAYGLATYSRGPVITGASASGATIDVTLAHDGGTDITPSTGITGFTVLSDGVPVTISSADRVAANKIRLTLAATPSGVVTLRYGYGKTPDITGLVKDNTALALPLETTDADVSVLQLKRILLTCLQRVGGAAAASVTGLRWAFFDQSTPNALTAPAVTGTAESTDGAGVLEIDVIGTALNVGDTGYLVTDTAAGVGFCGPVVVSG